MPTTTKNRAPYRHADGSNCWTKNCSRGNKNLVSLPVEDELSADIKAELDKAYETQKKENAKKARKQILPKAVVKTGKEVNELYRMKSLLKGGYNSRKFKNIKNANEEITFTKPSGGLWVSPVVSQTPKTKTDITAWQHLMGAYDDSEFHEDEESQNNSSSIPDYNSFDNSYVNADVKFNDDAKIAVIDSLEDYREILKRYPSYPDYSQSYSEQELEFLKSLSRAPGAGINSEGKAKRNIDFAELGKNYDALLVTEKGLYSCGRNFSRQDVLGNDVSLYMWDIPSAVIFNKNSFKVS
jgi:hypothetical protein